MLLHEEKTGRIIRACMNVHCELGMGFLEAVYQEALAIEFSHMGIPFEREKCLQIRYKGEILGKGYLADFICYDSIVVEVKALSALTDAHVSQVINYLKAAKQDVGLLVNFGERSLRWRRLTAFTHANLPNPPNPCDPKIPPPFPLPSHRPLEPRESESITTTNHQ